MSQAAIDAVNNIQQYMPKSNKKTTNQNSLVSRYGPSQTEQENNERVRAAKYAFRIRNMRKQGMNA